jgi:diguanylate cyclase (GGDEF)-like protein
MAEPASCPSGANNEALQAEIVRLNKVVRSLMDRVERATSLQGSDFNLFQTTILLEEQVRRRTDELESALREVRALQARMREQAIHDPLTGLYNRRYLDEMFGREIERAKRYKQPVSVVMGDVDHFKSVNDTRGHLAGDEVLKTFGELLRQHCRGSDIGCRYGGEEFLLILPDMSRDEAYRCAERLRIAVASTPIACGGSVVQVTASFGMATFPEDGTTPAALLAAADAALYTAKDAGRDRVRRYVAG